MGFRKGLKDFGKGFLVGIKMDDSEIEENDNWQTQAGKYAGIFTKEFSCELINELKNLAHLKLQKIISNKLEKHNE